MWLGSRVAVAVVRPAHAALIQPLASELPHTAGVALKKHYFIETVDLQCFVNFYCTAK